MKFCMSSKLWVLRVLLILFTFHFSLFTSWAQTKNTEVLFETTAGNIRIALYDETAAHPSCHQEFHDPEW